jgi:Protein NO VEIN, C-terminal
MARPRTIASLTGSIERALEAPWILLRHDGTGDDIARAQALDNIEDAGRSEDRVRHDYAGRYPLELLQNAHDACADANHRGPVRFAVTDSALIVANEGVPFTPERIRSLVRLGSSEKIRDRNRRHTIGYKGIGFTAVFEITDRPQIISSTVAFGFDRQRARREVRRILGTAPSDVPARGFPFALAEDAWADDADIVRSFINAGATTVIRLPLRTNRGADEVVQRLEETIPPEALLFMPHVSEIDLLQPDGRDRWTRTTGRRVGAGRLMHLRSDSGLAQSWLVAATSIKASRREIEALEDPLWADVSELGVAVGLPWRKGADPNAGEQRLHVYFPTDDELGRTLLIHGDFYVDSGRRHIETQGPGGEVSRAVAAAAAKLAATLAESIAARGGRPLLECLAETGHAAGFGGAMGELLEAALRRARIARPADGGRPRRPSDLKRLGMGSSRREQDLLPVLNRTSDLVRPGDDAEAAGELLEQLGAEELSWDEITGRVDLSRSRTAYMTGLRILARWLSSLEESDAAEVVSGLRNRPVVKDTSGRWRVPRDVVIRRPDSPDLPARLRMTELAVPAGRTIRRLVRALEIQELSTATALDIVIGAVRGRGFGKRRTEAEQIHAFMRQAWKQARREVEARTRTLGAIPVPTRKARGRRVGWNRADRVYFGSQWTSTRILESLYGRFGESEFLARSPKSERAARRSEAAFYGALGVAAKPRMKKRHGTNYEQNWRRGLSGFTEWLRLDDVRAALVCVDGHPQTARYISFSSLDRLDQVLESDDRETAAALARYLSDTESPFGSDAEIHCTHTSHAGSSRRKRAIGYQRWRLETTPWIPVRNDPSGADMRPPGEAWVGTRLPRWLLVPQARLKIDTAHGLRLVSADRPGAAALEGALRDLSQHFPDLADASDVVRDSAQWLLKRLDRAHQGRQAGSSGSLPPLPCTAGRHHTWSTSPVIADLAGLDDFANVEVLPAGAWRGLRRGYGLARASEVVKQDIEVGSRVRAPRLLSREQQARLAAVLASEGADEDRVATRLARLREFPVTFVQLRFSFDGQPAPAPALRPFHLEIRRDRANRVTGASLFVVPPATPATRIAIGRDLASYLEAPDMHASIALFLTNSDAFVESENISSEDIAEANRRVESHRRGHEDPDLEVEDLLEPFEEPTDGENEAREDRTGDAAAAPGDRAGSRAPGDADGAEPQQSLPPLDHDAVSAADVVGETPPVVAPQPRREGGSGGGGGEPGRTVDWARLERDRRLYGRRGEEVAYESERRRLAKKGWDADLVKWVSRDDELSAYDITSLNDDGSLRYIEVKATTGDDPSEPFPISTAELRFAFQQRAQYFIYRVTDVKAASPRIHRYRDPMGEIEAQRAYLRTSKALMGLPSPVEDPSANGDS